MGKITNILKRTIIAVAIIGFALIGLRPAFAEEPHAFPVPFTPTKDPTHREITFTGLPATGVIKIYTVEARLVAEVPIPPNAGLATWPATNKSGEKVATGVYIYEINGSQGKLVIIR